VFNIVSSAFIRPAGQSHPEGRDNTAQR